MASQRVKEALIDVSASATVSSIIDLGSNQLFAVHLPAAFTGTALSFTVAPQVDGTYQALYDDAGNAISITVAQGRTVGITGANAASLAACRFIKLVSNDTEVADRTIKLILGGTFGGVGGGTSTPS